MAVALAKSRTPRCAANCTEQIMPAIAPLMPRGIAQAGRNMIAVAIASIRNDERQYKVKELFDKVSEVFMVAGQGIDRRERVLMIYCSSRQVYGIQERGGGQAAEINEAEERGRLHS